MLLELETDGFCKLRLAIIEGQETLSLEFKGSSYMKCIQGAGSCPGYISASKFGRSLIYGFRQWNFFP